ncbi:MAG: hypothetical protein ACRDTT_18820, partial [Pseudonocardiaceae bacterium]
VLSGGVRVKRRVVISLTGPALTAPAHQWLIHEPEPLISGLSGRRISTGLVTRLTAMIAELRRMDDVAGGGSVLTLAQQQFEWVATLLGQASYDESTGRGLCGALAELGQFCGWGAYDAGQQGLAQRYNIAALRAAHSADDRPVGAYILGSMAKQAAQQGSSAEAVTLAETALVDVRNHRTPCLLALLHIRRAYAAATLQEGVALFDESFVRDRQLYSLADARTRPGRQQDLDAAAGLGMASIDLAKSLDSTLGANLLRDLCHRMTPHAKVPAVRDFLERAKGFAQR